jgi:hypothetical protein
VLLVPDRQHGSVSCGQAVDRGGDHQMMPTTGIIALGLILRSVVVWQWCMEEKHPSTHHFIL